MQRFSVASIPLDVSVEGEMSYLDMFSTKDDGTIIDFLIEDTTIPQHWG